ncbi:MAG: gamma-butyrobetaine hydroxylase-like domain-containing protein [Opitutaceae bacterium]
MIRPDDIQLIGNEVAVRWSDGAESFLAAPALRAASPSAASKGETDIFGRVHGGEAPGDFSNVTVVAWYPVGNYAIRFAFSDGHQTGLYSYELLRKLGETGRQG